MRTRWLGILLSVLGLIACGDKGDSGNAASPSAIQSLNANTNIVDITSGAVLVMRGDLKWMNPRLAAGEPFEDRGYYAEGVQITYSSVYNLERKRGLFCTIVLRKIPSSSQGFLLKRDEKIKVSAPSVESHGVVFRVQHPVVEALVVSLTSATVGDVEKQCFANVIAMKAAL